MGDQVQPGGRLTYSNRFSGGSRLGPIEAPELAEIQRLRRCRFSWDEIGKATGRSGADVREAYEKAEALNNG